MKGGSKPHRNNGVMKHVALLAARLASARGAAVLYACAAPSVPRLAMPPEMPPALSRYTIPRAQRLPPACRHNGKPGATLDNTADIKTLVAPGL
jgi:hypothetical protein